ncbi:MAG: hypothetical protein ACQESV_06450 [Thermodesulfobacteriota bacterium]
MPNHAAGASSNKDTAFQTQELLQRIHDLEDRCRACHEKIQTCMEREDPENGVHFSQEIHDLRQEKLRLDVEKDLLEKRLRRDQLEQGL